MDLNQQLLSDLAAELGLKEGGQEAVRAAVDMANGYMNKNDEVLLSEILKLKKIMRTDTEQYRKQIATLKTLKSVMNIDQQKRLDRMISLLEE